MNNQLENEIEKVERLIAQGKTESAINQLATIIRENKEYFGNSDHYKEILLVSSKYHELKSQNLGGIIDDDTYQLNLSKINKHTIEIKSNIRNDIIEIKSNNIRALLVDDYMMDLQVLSYKIKQYCPGIEIIGATTSPLEAIKLVYKELPDVVFLDLSMPEMNGFDLLKSISDVNVYAIFITGYDGYELQALKLSALAYLLKPVSVDELLESVGRLKKTIKNNLKYKVLKENLISPSKKVAIQSHGKTIFLKIYDISFIRVNKETSTIHLINRKEVVSTQSIKHYEQLLQEFDFYRVNRKELININQIKKMLEDHDSNLVEMVCGSKIRIARVKKREFIKRIQNLGRPIQITSDKEKSVLPITLLNKARRLTPHFHSNLMNSLSALILKEKKEEALEFISNLSSLFRLISKDNLSIFHTLDDEIHLVKKYVELEQIRYSEQIKLKIFIEENVNKNILIPKMFIHTFINNSIKHCIDDDTKSLIVKLYIESNQTYTHIIVSDNGKGIRHSDLTNKENGGLKLLREIIENLNKVYLRKTEYSIDFGSSESGTTINLLIPTEYVLGE